MVQRRLLCVTRLDHRWHGKLRRAVHGGRKSDGCRWTALLHHPLLPRTLWLQAPEHGGRGRATATTSTQETSPVAHLRVLLIDAGLSGRGGEERRGEEIENVRLWECCYRDPTIKSHSQ
jgi:hypothetical protein